MIYKLIVINYFICLLIIKIFETQVLSDQYELHGSESEGAFYIFNTEGILKDTEEY